MGSLEVGIERPPIKASSIYNPTAGIAVITNTVKNIRERTEQCWRTGVTAWIKAEPFSQPGLAGMSSVAPRTTSHHSCYAICQCSDVSLNLCTNIEAHVRNPHWGCTWKEAALEPEKIITCHCPVVFGSMVTLCTLVKCWALWWHCYSRLVYTSLFHHSFLGLLSLILKSVIKSLMRKAPVSDFRTVNKVICKLA